MLISFFSLPTDFGGSWPRIGDGRAGLLGGGVWRVCVCIVRWEDDDLFAGFKFLFKFRLGEEEGEAL